MLCPASAGCYGDEVINKSRKIVRKNLKRILNPSEAEIKKNMSSEVKLLIIVIASFIIVGSDSTTAVRNGAYHNVVIDVQPFVPADDCSNFLLRLEVRFFIFFFLEKLLKRFLSHRKYFEKT